MATSIQASNFGHQFSEQIAVEAITPGMLLEIKDSSGVAKVGFQNTADDKWQGMVAVERMDALKGVSDAYAAGDLVLVDHPQRGSYVYLLVASGENIDIGELLQPTNTGKAKSLGTGSPIAVSLESTSGALAADRLVKALII